MICSGRSMIQSTDAFPLNFGFTGKGNTSRSENNGESRELVEQLLAGAIGYVKNYNINNL